MLYNCTLTGNSVLDGGGAYGDYGHERSCTLYNCIVYFNTASNGPNYSGNCTVEYSCTTPLPTNGIGNITGPPLFLDMAAGDYRLREDSLCIDAGTNLLGFPIMVLDSNYAWAIIIGRITAPTDILGNTRFIDGNADGKVAWDIGAYEFNSFKPPRFSVSPQLTSDGWKLNITGAANKWARLQRSGNLKDWEDIWSGSMGAEGFKQLNDEEATRPKALFYRVVVP